MGWGDEVMSMGRLERFHECTGKRGAILNDIGRPRDCVLWHGHPSWDANATSGIKDGSGCRPYITRWETWQGKPRAVFNDVYRPRAGKIYLTQAERDSVTIDGPFIVVNPTVKANASPNKQWGLDRWREAIKGLPLPVYQLGVDAGEVIKGARFFRTESIRHAAAVIEKAALVMTNEGGLHHIAASFERPAVVVFGAYVNPLVTGYPFHTNLHVQTADGYCGRYAPCEHCNQAMAQITPDMVRMEAMRILGA